MARYGIAIDTSKCMACYNCFMACKDEHCGFSTAVSAAQPHTGQSWIRIESEERGDDTRRIKTSNVAIPCMHCKDAPCAKAAVNGAVYTRPDGIVIIDPEKAKGQKQIVEVCPYKAVYWNEELLLPQKCTMCAHLLDEGYSQPRCVEACPNEALFFGDLDDPNSEVSKAAAKERVTPLNGALDTAVIHLNIPTIFFAGSVYLPDDEVAENASVELFCAETGDRRAVTTNYFGDWEVEWLDKGRQYEITITYPGCETVKLSVTADTNRYVGEFILAPQK